MLILVFTNYCYMRTFTKNNCGGVSKTTTVAITLSKSRSAKQASVTEVRVPCVVG